MNPARLRELLDRVAAGQVTPEAATEQLKSLPFEDLGFAKVDHHRALRHGMPEVIFGEGKTAPQIIEIARRMRADGDDVLITRLKPDAAERVLAAVPELTYAADARIAYLRQSMPDVAHKGTIAVVAAGTADLPVAEEAVLTAELIGNPVQRLYDVGVAGIHRLLACFDDLRRANVLIVVAGMEGALPSVVGGLVDRPVIAVPTSVGYGASFGGLAALLAMLNSCAAGVTVVNIDNGFGAAVAASVINRTGGVKR
jgi:pyridinium-3,5-biscarboxylic acid mononucleotide synthase